jgi:hypothetical protein
MRASCYDWEELSTDFAKDQGHGVTKLTLKNFMGKIRKFDALRDVSTDR